MKITTTIVLSLFAATSIFSQTPCENGMAGPYPCENLDLLAFIPLGDMGASTANDIWGWTDPDTGKEYALLGLNNSTAFVDVTSPTTPVIVGYLPTQTGPSTWRDIKVFNDYAFIVSEAPDHGMQVFDLSRLEQTTDFPTTFDTDAFYSGFGNCHNIAIDEASGFAYCVGTSTFSGGLHILDINDPLNPTLAGSFADGGYIHDSQVVLYNGPDLEHQGKQIAFNSNGPANILDIVDVTVKDDCERIASADYEGEHYIHQGWLSEDHRYFFHNDELDEINEGHNTHTYLWDLADLDNPLFLGFYDSGNSATDHNNYTHRSHLFQSNYKSGLRILEIDQSASLDLQEVAFFDTHPEDNTNGTDGNWSNYPYFESETIIVSNIETGLFVLGFSDGFELSLVEHSSSQERTLSVFPNPAKDQINISLSESTDAQQLLVYDFQGKIVLQENWSENKLNTVLALDGLTEGVYILQLGEVSTRITIQ